MLRLARCRHGALALLDQGAVDMVLGHSSRTWPVVLELLGLPQSSWPVRLAWPERASRSAALDVTPSLGKIW